MINVYDLEVFPNFFSIAWCDVNKQDEKHTLYIHKDVNHLKEIVSLFTKNNPWWVGYNSTSFDDPIIQHLIDSYFMYEGMDTDILTMRIFEYASDVIDNDKSKYIDVNFNRLDLMRIGGLYKSLKLVGVNLKHNRIQDLPYPIHHEVSKDEVDEILEYNCNDIDLTCSLYHDMRDKILLRQELTKKYGQNLMNLSRSQIANKILEADYAKYSRIPIYRFKKENTDRDIVHFDECISDKVRFKTDNLKQFLNKIKGDSATKDTKIEYNVKVNGTHYDIAKGGIHSNMPPEIYESNELYTITDADVSSYYPNIMINEGAKPKHLHSCFIPLLHEYTTTRLKAKATGDKVASDGLKIVINSIYGKMGNNHHFLKDLKALYKTTLNGQLYLLMLIERLEMAGIPVFYANTDGVTARVPVEKEDEYHEICSEWQDYTGFDLDFDEYSKCIIRDVNNYIWIPMDKEKDNKYKGFFDINRWKDVTKSFDKPVIPYAINKYFTEGIPVEESITNHDDILDFCMAQKPGKKFDIQYHYLKDGKELDIKECQRTNRYYIGKGGGSLYKHHNGKLTSMVANQPVYILNDVVERDASLYPIKYRYYIQEAYKTVNLFKDKQQELFA